MKLKYPLDTVGNNPYTAIMILKNAEELATQLMHLFKVDDYTFSFNQSLSYFGWCSTEKKTITLSPKLTELNTEAEVKDTILHEIAHALTPGCAHNEVWQRVARAIGANGKRCYDETVETPTHKWTATCPNCSKSIQRHKKNKRLYCGTCHKAGHRISKSIMFRWKLNK